MILRCKIIKRTEEMQKNDIFRKGSNSKVLNFNLFTKLCKNNVYYRS